jgi:hypothetical protein
MVKVGIGRKGFQVLALTGLAIGVVAGGLLALVKGPVLWNAGDCMPPPGYVGGGYRCYRIGHPHLGIAVVVAMIGIAAFAALWLLSTRSRVTTDVDAG